MIRLLAHVHGYPPDHNAGAEWMLHSILRWLLWRGHQVRVLASTAAERYEIGGVPVHPIGARRATDAHYAWSNVVLTHLDLTTEVLGLGRVNARPVVHLVHNHRQLDFYRVTSAPLVIFCAAWIAEKVGRQGPAIIVHPPVFVRDYDLIAANGRSAATLVNTNSSKGAETVFEMARRMPERAFLGVRGAYGHQIDPDLPNVRVVPNTADMRQVYSRTRVLLMPSSYESWGRVAIEAAVSGIPTIAHPTPGLLESLGDAGTFVDRDDVDGWCAALRAFDDPRVYTAASERARARAREIADASWPELEALESALLKVVAR